MSKNMITGSYQTFHFHQINIEVTYQKTELFNYSKSGVT